METEQSSRLRTLLQTGLAISSELSLDGVLQRIVEAAALVTGARYAALGVIDPSGTSLERFVTYGIDDETRAVIGDLPRGRGILGALITDARTLRLHDLSEDPRSVGFPAGHPPMRAFLGTPIVLRGVAYGNLYLTEKEDGTDFDEEDEELVALLSAQAAVAIENARLYESATAWSKQLESLQEISAALAGELELPRLLQLVVERLRELIHARVVAIALPAPDGLRIEAIAAEQPNELLHELIPYETKVGAVLKRAQSERVDAILDDPEVIQELARQFGATTGLYVPLLTRGGAIGIAFAHDREGRDPRFTSADLRSGGAFRPARSDRRRPLAARPARLAQTRDRGPGDRTPPACAGAARRDRTGAHFGSAGPEDGRERRGQARGAGGAARARRSHVAGRPSARGRAAAEGARRLRPRAGGRTAGRDLRRGDRDRRRFRVTARRGAPAVRGRDDPVPDRAGVVDEHRQACGRPSRQRAARAARGRRDRARGGRRPRIRRGRRASRRASGWPGCASASPCSTVDSTIESTRGAGTSLVAEVPLS